MWSRWPSGLNVHRRPFQWPRMSPVRNSRRIKDGDGDCARTSEVVVDEAPRKFSTAASLALSMRQIGFGGAVIRVSGTLRVSWLPVAFRSVHMHLFALTSSSQRLAASVL